MSTQVHDLILLLGRPASGKSEIIDYLQRMDPVDRLRRMRVGTPVILDDFPLLWAWFEEDSILERMGRPRLHSTPDGYFLHDSLWEVLIRRLCLEYEKLCASGETKKIGEPSNRGSTVMEDFPTTVFMEFSRGSQHGGYRDALGQLSDTVLACAAALYVRVSFEESLRKNRRRFNPDKPHRVLEHGLSDEKMHRLYRLDDWDALERPDPVHLLVRGHVLPAVEFENEDDVTTPRGDALGRRLEATLEQLWVSRRKSP